MGGEFALSEEVSRSLRSISDSVLAGQISNLWSLLRELASNPGQDLAAASQMAADGPMLVHSAYFETPDVRQLVLAHMTASQDATTLSESLPLSHVAHVAKFKKALEAALNAHLSKRNRSMISRTWRRVPSIPSWAFIILGAAIAPAPTYGNRQAHCTYCPR